MNKIFVKKVYNKNKDKEWALIKKMNTDVIVKWLGKSKPSLEKINEEKENIKHLKNVVENIITELHKTSEDLRKKSMIHIADAITNCIISIVKNVSQDHNAIRLGKIISILNAKGENEIADRLDVILPDIVSCRDVEISSITEAKEADFNIKVSALRAYNIAKILKNKYISGELNSTDFEYTKMKELETLLKAGFTMPIPVSYDKLPDDVDNWWDHFEQKNKTI